MNEYAAENRDELDNQKKRVSTNSIINILNMFLFNNIQTNI